MSHPPVPPPGVERRRFPRFGDVFATVSLAHGDETLVLKIRDVSLGGAAVNADANDLSWLAVGSRHELLIFDARSEEVAPVRIQAQVVRLDRLGVAFSWDVSDHAIREEVARLLHALCAPSAAAG